MKRSIKTFIPCANKTEIIEMESKIKHEILPTSEILVQRVLILKLR